MKKLKGILAAILVLAMALSMLGGCGNNSDSDTGGAGAVTTAASNAGSGDNSGGDSAQSADSSANPKVIKAGITDPYGSFLISAAANNNKWANHLIYDFIMEYDADNQKWTSKTLDSWEWVDDLTLKLEIKDGISFSDGTRLTGEDMLYTMQSYVINGHPEGNSYFSKVDYEKSYLENDGLTLVLVFTEVYGAALSTLQIPIMCKAFCEEHPDGDEIWRTKPVGSGPYVVEDAVVDSYIKLAKRADYWNIDKYSYGADEIYIYYYSDNTALFSDYQAGNINVALDLNYTEYDQAAAGAIANTMAVTLPSYDVSLLTVNPNGEYGGDIAVRQALYYAVNWYEAGLAGNGSLCSEATSHFQSDFPAYSYHASSYDPDKARQILEDAGYSDGEVVLRMVFFSDISSMGTIAEAIQAYAKGVGITVNIEAYDAPTVMQIYMTGECDLTIQSLTNSGGNASMEPDRSLSGLSTGGTPVMQVGDNEFYGLLSDALATTDQAARTEIYKQADEWLYENYHAFPMFETHYAYCYNTEAFAEFDIGLFGQYSYLCNAVFK